MTNFVIRAFQEWCEQLGDAGRIHDVSLTG
jgi:hypothetical protein